MDVIEQQTEALDLHTNTLQILLGKGHLQVRSNSWERSKCCSLPVFFSEETLLQCTDLASCVRLLKKEHLNTGLELIRRIQERLMAILQHSTRVKPV